MLARGGRFYSLGDPESGFPLMRRGAPRIPLPWRVEGGGRHSRPSGRGAFWGGRAFCSQMTRLNDATALEDTELYVLQREQFEVLREEHKRLACTLVEELAKVLAMRLRYADKELMAMQE